jgi:hypothetical protein
MLTGQESILMLGLAVYIHCVEQYKPKTEGVADIPQPLLVKSSMQYLQEKLISLSPIQYQFMFRFSDRDLCTFKILENEEIQLKIHNYSFLSYVFQLS